MIETLGPPLVAVADASSTLEHQLPWWALLVLVGVVLLVAHQLAFFIGGRVQPRRQDEGKDMGTLVGALLALLGLLLAFSFSIAEQRFAARKSLVLQEANAIGTTYLRAQMLPDGYGEPVEALLRRYVDVRVGARTPEAIDRALRVSGALHRELWAEASAVARKHPDSEIVALFVDSLNETIDLHAARVTVALYQRLPSPILYALYAVSVLSMALLGYSAGLMRWRALAPMLALVLSVSSVIVLIIELDRPGGSVFRIDQRALRDLQETMSESVEDATSDLASARSRRSG